MKRTWRITIIVWLALTIASIVVGNTHALAATSSAPAMAAPRGLSLLEMKITGDEFIVLQNNSGAPIADLSSYWLTVYNNVNPLASGVSSSTQQLPAAGLLAGQTLLLSAEPMAVCGASVAGKLSISLGDSGGFMQLAQDSLDAKGNVVQTPTDVTSWSSAASGIIQSIPSNTKDPRAAFYRYLNGNSYLWQLADLDTTNACQLNFVVAAGQGSSTAVTPLTLAATSPPATILGTVTADDSTISGVSLPPADAGLQAPQLSELLPNPLGSGNDATDEFIELYNPNGVTFDLSGFTLQTGTTANHSYVFPAGTMLAASSFQAFYSAQTGLSLSNSSGKAQLLDPLGNAISSTATYGTAKDGQAWALASGTWYWTTQATPGLANVIKQPAAKKSKATAASKSKKKTSATTSRKKVATKLTSSTSGADAVPTAPNTPIHKTVLAAVALAAVLYGAYEYRRDLANRVQQFRANLSARRANRKTPARAGSD